MKNYRDLFEQEFGGDSRIFDIEGTGLPLGIKTLSLDEAMGLLGGNYSEIISQRRGERRGAERAERKKGTESTTSTERKEKLEDTENIESVEREESAESEEKLEGAERAKSAEGEEEKKDSLIKNDVREVGVVRGKNSEIASFFETEKKRLEELRSFLTGEAAADNERLNVLIDECDYVWAHFPDYSGGRRPPLSDISFLKRLRVEIEPMLRLLERKQG